MQHRDTPVGGWLLRHVAVVAASTSLQDIAIVPFLVLLPLIESNGGMEGASADTLLQVWASHGLITGCQYSQGASC